MNLDTLFLSLIILTLAYGLFWIMQYKEYFQQKIKDIFKK